MQGYKLVDPPLASRLTLAQSAFVALTQSKYLEVMLSPYLEEPKPSEEAMQAEAYRIGQARKKFKDVDMGGKNLFYADVTKPLYT